MPEKNQKSNLLHETKNEDEAEKSLNHKENYKKRLCI